MEVYNNYSIHKENPNKKVFNNTQNIQNIRFNGILTRTAQKCPIETPEILEQMKDIFTREQGIVGTIPGEFVTAIRNNLKCSDDIRIKNSIMGIKQSFISATNLLNNIEKIKTFNQKVYFKTITVKQCCESHAKKLTLQYCNDAIESCYLPNKEKDRLKKIAHDLLKEESNKFLPNKIYSKLIEKLAAKTLEKGFKENKVIPQNAKIEIERLGEGQFGTVYKVSFLDQNGQRIFRDKAIKCFKNINTIRDLEFEKDIKEAEILAKKTSAYIKQMTKNAERLKRENIIIPQDYQYFSQIRFNPKAFNAKKKEHRFNLYLKCIHAKKENGITAETGIINYFKATTNNMIKSNIVNYHYTDLFGNFALFDFSDQSQLGKVTKIVDYDARGLELQETEPVRELVNIVDKRLVDISSFHKKNKLMPLNPQAVKTYIKISRIQGKKENKVIKQRIDRWNELYEKAAANKVPASYQVLLGLNEAKKLIPVEFHNQLICNK